MKFNKNDNSVLKISLVLIICIVMWGLISPNSFGFIGNKALSYMVDKFGWLYLSSMTVFLVFSIFLAFSKYGNIKLGDDDSKPEYSYISWFAMLFSAGMGIGLVFWGVAEPLNHYINPMGITGGTENAVNFAMKKSFFHWGLHPWAVYSLLALSLAYIQFRKKYPCLISNMFIPLFGRNISKKKIGKFIDVLAIFATISGAATSLGLGTLQINSGLNYLFNIPENKIVQIIIIIVVTFLFIYSAVGGVDKGIKILSNLNVLMAVMLLAVAMIIGPTSEILNNFINGMSNYGKDLLAEVNPFGKGDWYKSWTIFYWAWWIAWAPFVGTFIARISKGRTIREFIFGVLLVPSIVSFFWFSTFGTMAVNIGYDTASKAIGKTSTAFFIVMSNYPYGKVISIIAIILLGTFFVTSADSATFVLGMMSRKGKLNPDSKVKIIWGIVQSLLALALLLSGGLKMLQTMSIVAAFPFVFIILGYIVCLVKFLREEKIENEVKEKIRMFK
ncbi:BCCT family transporter [Tepidibacter formicigenes]|uniref:Glycine betaine transporter n=1 Tax=Tepidibacter formicigenes DSM 15518 TaxID=1123349 RepID=A0A1M6NVZ7_9FIRM|nr:BCCT family transporter [Tepidibacter formicigenes]SHJ99832.1 glycine betaine transporter [Tepidibacter formicigenes DSM 15518]